LAFLLWSWPYGAKYLTGMVTSVLPYETFSLIKNNILHQSKNYKNHFENSNFWAMWPLGHVGYVTYSLINMLIISTRNFYDKLRPHILSVGTTVNAPLRGSSAIEWKPYEGWTYISECPTCTVVGAYKYLKTTFWVTAVSWDFSRPPIHDH
jgi:hypothetical protein